MEKINADKIKNELKTDFIGKNIILYDKTDSTNTQAKLNHNEADGTVFIAESQTSGRGSRGREWISPDGTGIWMSILLKPEIPIEKVSQITLIAGLAVKKAIGDDVMIKWPNDVVAQKKKVCGILTETSIVSGKIQGVVCGIGINVNDTEFPDEIAQRATSLCILKGEKLSRNTLIVSVLDEFEKLYKIFIRDGLGTIIEEYRNACITLSKNIKVVYDNKEVTGVATNITEIGSLIIKTDDGIELEVNSGEVSIRGMYGYV